MAKKVIDMRSRPAFLHDFYGKTRGTPEFEVVKWLNGRVGSKNPEHFTASRDLEAFVKEIKDTRISASVVVGRDTPAIKHSNDEIHDLVRRHKELVGVGSIDPHRWGVRAAVQEVERAVGTLGLRAINVEPGFGSPPRPADDPTLFPIYDACEQLGVPVTIMSGPTAPSLDMVRPAAVGHVAKAFPKLSIVCYHGFYPFVNEIIGVALRWENVYIVPDMYIFAPGSRLYVEAANGAMRRQILFGSSYPFRPMAQSINDYRTLGFDEDVIDDVMYGNAKRVLGLSV
ncbi:MAG: amidohydrolase [Burkholderiales bacterium]|nr:amidohydrolase family protein [Burkholderiales bacterium]MDE1926892.1 amidohydrolase [Burkholderiales bacterium]MDE2158328.1 amidohydrolase [Burkholderiales bacterium]MDE2505080.1 amidohydrolase [Burkholderiales bacterium]